MQIEPPGAAPVPPGPPKPPKKSMFDKIRNLGLRVLTFAKSLFQSGDKFVRGNAVLKKAEAVISKAVAPAGRFLPEAARSMIALHRGKILLGLVAIPLLFSVRGLFGGDKAKKSLESLIAESGKDNKDAAVPAKGFKVGRFNFEDSLNALGTIKGAVEFKLSFEIPGTVSSINYREGERYEEGALLLSLRQDDILLRLKRAQAEMNKAQTQAEIASQKVNEHQKLFTMGAIPKTTLDNVKLELDSSNFEAEAARLEVKANEAMLEKSNLYAPSAGMIGELNVEEGESITPNTLLGTHIMTEYVYAEFGIVERDVNKIALGQKARVFVDAFPDKTFEGVIENIAPVVAGTSRTATVRVRIENPDRLLLPGMFARIRILLYSKKNTLVIPTDAIQGKEEEKFVFVLREEKVPGQPDEPPPPPQPVVMPEGTQSPGSPTAGMLQGAGAEGAGAKGAEPEEEKRKNVMYVAEKRPITVGYTRPDYSQIDAGVSEGEIVAISGLEKLEDGKKVRLLETQEAEI